MSSTPLASWALIACVFVLAGTVKGVVGLGLPTVSMALLALTMAPAEAAALLIVPSFITNVWQMRPWSTARAVIRRLSGLQVGIVAGTLAGAWWLGAPAGAWASISLGIALIAYAAWGLAGAKLSVAPRTARWLGPVVGAVTGFMTAATGVFVIPAVPYLQALALERDELIQAMGLSFTTSTIALALGLWINASYSTSEVGTSVVMLLPALAGMSIGQVLRRRMSPDIFKRCLFVSLALLGAHMVLREVLR